MCSTLYIDAEQRIIHKTSELAALVGRENILWGAEDDNDPPTPEPEYFANDSLSFCLCPVDVEATMKRAGYAVTFDECFDYLAHREVGNG